MYYKKNVPKKTYRKKVYRKKSNNATATNIKKIVRSQVLEKKFSPEIGISGGISSSGSVVSCNQIAQGDTNTTRTGNVITASGLYIKGTLKNSASASAGTYFRFALVRDNQQVGDTSPAFTDIYETAFPTSGLKKSNLGRFSILATKEYYINQSYASQVVLKPFKHFQKLSSKIRYNGVATTDIQKNGLYIAVVSDQATNTPTFDVIIRLHFTDA